MAVETVNEVNQVRALVRNAWDWGLAEFCRATQLDPQERDVQEAFHNFQKAADALRQLDDHILSVVTKRPGVN
ncbi:MAG: hypothetical protein ACREGR_05230 [Minisyncoccia bacterium]